MRYFLVFIILNLIFCCRSENEKFNSSDSWERVAEIKDEIAWAESFVINNKAYVGLGVNKFGFSNKFFKYDPIANKWTQVSDFPGEPRRDAISFSINGKGYIGLGQNDSTLARFNDFWEYDPNSNSWKKIADFPSTSRARAVSFIIGGKAYVGFGISYEKTEKDFYSYDPVVGKWSAKKKFPNEARLTATAFSDNRFGYIIGGNSCCGSYASIFSEVWKYDPKEDIWIFHSTYPFKKRTRMIYEDFFQYGIMGLGVTLDGQFFSDIYLYKSLQDKWYRLPEFPKKRHKPISFIVDSAIYIGGGEDRRNKRYESTFYKLDLREIFF